MAARADGSRWAAIAAACGVTMYEDLAGVIYRITGDTGAELLFSATQDAVRQLVGGEHRYPPLAWDCAECGQQVTDRAPAGGRSTSSMATSRVALDWPGTRPPATSDGVSRCLG